MTQIELDHDADWDLYEEEDTEWDLLAKGLAHVAEPDFEPILPLSDLDAETRARARTRLGNHICGAIKRFVGKVHIEFTNREVCVTVRLSDDSGRIEKVEGWVTWDAIATAKGNPLADEAGRLLEHLEASQELWARMVADGIEEVPF